METYLVTYICNNKTLTVEIHVNHKDHVSNEMKKYHAAKILSVEKIVTCQGCLYDASGQKDHMDEGGCLYDYSYL